jgi:hypothetical protein
LEDAFGKHRMSSAVEFPDSERDLAKEVSVTHVATQEPLEL